MPTLIWNEDFESGTIAAALSGGTSNASIDTAVFFSGVRSAKFSGDPAWGLKSFAAGAITVFRGYVNLNPLPANGGELMTFNGGPRFGRDQTTGKFGFVNGTSVTMDHLSGVTVVAGQWYRIEIRLNQTANPWVIDYQIDGVAQTQITYAVAAGSVSGIYLGRTVSLGPSINLNWDAVAASQTSADYPLGPVPVSYPRTASDTGLTVTDTLARTVAAAMADTGLAVTDAVARNASFGRAVTDTGLTASDTLARPAIVFGRSAADTGVVFSDALAASKTLMGTRPVADTGLSVSDTLLRVALTQRGLSDTGLTVAGDAVARTLLRGRTLTDTGVTVNAVLVRGTTRLSRPLVDTGSTVTEIVSRTFTPFVPFQPPLRRRVGMTIVGEREFSDLFK
jgi:hypothetical protein